MDGVGRRELSFFSEDLELGENCVGEKEEIMGVGRNISFVIEAEDSIWWREGLRGEGSGEFIKGVFLLDFLLFSLTPFGWPNVGEVNEDEGGEIEEKGVISTLESPYFPTIFQISVSFWSTVSPPVRVVDWDEDCGIGGVVGMTCFFPLTRAFPEYPGIFELLPTGGGGGFSSFIFFKPNCSKVVCGVIQLSLGERIVEAPWPAPNFST